MTPPERQALRALCQAATPGPWYHDPDMPDSVDMLDHPTACADDMEPEDAAFIAAANPQAVLSLLDEVERLEAEKQNLLAENKRLFRRVPKCEWNSQCKRETVPGYIFCPRHKGLP